jgi:hypothetical protein
MCASTVQNQETLLNYFKIANTGNLEKMKAAIREMCTHNYMLHDPSTGKPEVGIDEVISQMEEFTQNNSNLKVEVQDIFGVGDKTATRVTYEWINKNTDVVTKGMGIVISRFENGKLVEEWQVMAS